MYAFLIQIPAKQLRNKHPRKMAQLVERQTPALRILGSVSGVGGLSLGL